MVSGSSALLKSGSLSSFHFGVVSKLSLYQTQPRRCSFTIRLVSSTTLFSLIIWNQKSKYRKTQTTERHTHTRDSARRDFCRGFWHQVMAAQPLQRKSAPAATAQADDFYGERNTGIRLISTGKIDEEAEAARKSLIRSMGKKPKNRFELDQCVNDKWRIVIGRFTTKRFGTRAKQRNHLA